MLDSNRTKLLCAASFIIGACLAILCGIGAMSLLVRHYRHLGLTLAFKRTVAEEPGTAAHPWGSLEAIEIPLANPDGVIPDPDQRSQKPKWFFEGYSETRLDRFLRSCDLRPVEREFLLNKQYWSIRSNGCEITPPERLVWALDHHGRQQIYAVLARSVDNYAQRFPFRIPLDGFDYRFKGSGLSEQSVGWVKRLTYTNADYLCFTDLQVVRPLLKTNEFNDLLETLYQVPTYLLRLRVDQDADVALVIKYWGRGGREKLIAPLITSLSKVPGGGTVNIAYLLPPFARLRLYTYPGAWNDLTSSKEDCFFSTMNFFNEEEDTNFFDAAYGQKVLESDFAPVTDEPGFGDVAAFCEESGKVVHTCVYLADDFVFTKNGVNPAHPWVLMKLPDLLPVYYLPGKQGHVLFLRRKAG